MIKENRTKRATAEFAKLIEVIDKLRSPGGCPWDQKQTHETLKPFLIEESYEVIDAIDQKNMPAISEELGDLLLQIMLHSQIGFEKDKFNIADVIEGISNKMINRHPHVFNKEHTDKKQVTTADDVLKNWEQIKKKENKNKDKKKKLLDGLPSALPGLQKAASMGERTGRVGFDWPNAASVRKKVIEELNELDDAIKNCSDDQIEHEIGDLLFAVAQWSRHLKKAPEEAIRKSCDRFSTRFNKMNNHIANSGKQIENCNMRELEVIWQKIKKEQ